MLLIKSHLIPGRWLSTPCILPSSTNDLLRYSQCHKFFSGSSSARSPFCQSSGWKSSITKPLTKGSNCKLYIEKAYRQHTVCPETSTPSTLK